jgi:lysophospholipase L1-like esterase
MQGSEHKNGRLPRCIQHAALAVFLSLALPGCLPGLSWGDDEPDAIASPNPQAAPTLNRGQKSSFLSLQMPSAVSAVQARLMPDLGSGFMNAFSGSRPAAADASSQYATPVEALPGFEPMILAPAKALANFYAQLTALASGKRTQPVTILHLGDDHIAYDRFAGTLREHLVNRFGSAGHGLMTPGLYPLRGMKADRGGKWNLASAAAGAQGPFGISGASMTAAAPDAWLRFTSAQTTFDWAEVTFATGPGFGTAMAGLDGDLKLVPTNAARSGQTSMRVSSKTHEVMVRPKGDGPITVLSVATGTSGPGIAYSNLGLPGATGLTAEKWNLDFAANDLRKLNPDLILIEYGTREGFDDTLDVNQYETRLSTIVAQIKQRAPQASILIAGPPDAARLPGFAGSAGAQVCRALNPQEIQAYGSLMDRSDERLGRWHTPPKLIAVRAAQRRIAASAGAFYWDWSKYMGGPCSIHAWAMAVPPLAEPDHITMTEAGDNRSARALFAEIMAGYEAYQHPFQPRVVTAAVQAVPVAHAAAVPPAAPKKRKTVKPKPAPRIVTAPAVQPAAVQ